MIETGIQKENEDFPTGEEEVGTPAQWQHQKVIM